jgi:hypothetical protein
VVLVAAGLLIRTIQNLGRVNPGFDPKNVRLFRVDPTLNHYDSPRIRRLYSDILGRLRALPGVQAASFSHHPLVSQSSSSSMIHVVDGAALRDALQVNRLIVDRAFFGTMRIPLLAGATFGGLEQPSDIRPVVINRRFALRVFDSPAPLGHRFRFGERSTQPTYEVIGVAGDVPIVDLRREIPPTVYFSYRAEETHQVTFAVRSAGPPGAPCGPDRSARGAQERMSRAPTCRLQGVPPSPFAPSPNSPGHGH